MTLLVQPLPPKPLKGEALRAISDKRKAPFRGHGKEEDVRIFFVRKLKYYPYPFGYNLLSASTREFT